jgi:hypothetical protein
MPLDVEILGGTVVEIQQKSGPKKQGAAGITPCAQVTKTQATSWEPMLMTLAIGLLANAAHPSIICLRLASIERRR